MSLRIRAAQPEDTELWLPMRVDLWPSGSEAEHRADIERYFSGDAGEPQAVLLAVDSPDKAVGFAELSLRAYAEGCRSSPVAYLEGWYVAPQARRRGVGRALVEAAAEWGRAQGCAEFASDTSPTNLVSAAAHRALGFDEAGLVLCFRRDL